MVAPVDLTGEVSGYLVAESPAGSDGQKRLWLCRCVCGGTTILPSSDFRYMRKRGVQASCGCKRLETIGRKNTKHNMSHHPAHAVWASMLARCHKETHSAYKNYGARGIFVCARWRNSFENFWADMGPTYKEGLSLERVDNNAGYNPDNCVWATRTEQARNRRNSVGPVMTPKGEMYPSDIALEFNIPKSTVDYRIKAGLSGAELVAPPKNGNHLTGSLRA